MLHRLGGTEPVTLGKDLRMVVVEAMGQRNIRSCTWMKQGLRDLESHHLMLFAVTTNTWSTSIEVVFGQGEHLLVISDRSCMFH